jgi:hypothetical protein
MQGNHIRCLIYRRKEDNVPELVVEAPNFLYAAATFFQARPPEVDVCYVNSPPGEPGKLGYTRSCVMRVLPVLFGAPPFKK